MSGAAISRQGSRYSCSAWTANIQGHERQDHLFCLLLSSATEWEGTGSGDGLFLKTHCHRRKGKNYIFEQGKFLLDIKKDFTM